MKISSGLLMSSMLVLTSLSASDAAWAGNNKDKNKGANPNKTLICHLTSSSKNPSVLIHVSTSAAAAHYAHGDPEEIRYLENGDCAEPEPEPEPVYVEMCAISDFAGGVKTWAVDYYPATGYFTGLEVNGLQLTGTVTEKGNMFAPGKHVTLDSIGVDATSTAESIVVSAANLPVATFPVVVNFVAPARNTTISFTEGCGDGQGSI